MFELEVEYVLEDERGPGERVLKENGQGNAEGERSMGSKGSRRERDRPT